MESCVQEVVWNLWSDRSLINSSQFGFIPNLSCVDQLLSFLKEITLYTHEGNWADSIYLDFSKAFNSVSHERLLQKLSALGLKENMYNWIKSFLTKRFEAVGVCAKTEFPKTHGIWCSTRKLSGSSCSGFKPSFYVNSVFDLS